MARNRSGVVGVCKCKQTGQWKVQISPTKGHYVFVGRFESFADAVYARYLAEKKYGFIGMSSAKMFLFGGGTK